MRVFKHFQGGAQSHRPSRSRRNHLNLRRMNLWGICNPLTTTWSRSIKSLEGDAPRFWWRRLRAKFRTISRWKNSISEGMFLPGGTVHNKIWFRAILATYLISFLVVNMSFLDCQLTSETWQKNEDHANSFRNISRFPWVRIVTKKGTRKCSR